MRPERSGRDAAAGKTGTRSEVNSDPVFLLPLSSAPVRAREKKNELLQKTLTRVRRIAKHRQKIL
jgi:hypothetical protein